MNVAFQRSLRPLYSKLECVTSWPKMRATNQKKSAWNTRSEERLPFNIRRMEQNWKRKKNKQTNHEYVHANVSHLLYACACRRAKVRRHSQTNMPNMPARKKQLPVRLVRGIKRNRYVRKSVTPESNVPRWDQVWPWSFCYTVLFSFG